MEVPKVVLLIFTSGKIVFAGAKTREQIYQAYVNIYPVLFSFKKKQSMMAHSHYEKAVKELLIIKAKDESRSIKQVEKPAE